MSAEHGWWELATALKAIADADSGAGGLTENATWFLDEAHAKQTGVYYVLSLVAESREDTLATANKANTYTFDVAVWSDRQSFSTHRDMVDRVIAQFDRVAPATGNGWTASHCFYEGVVDEGPEDEQRRTVMQFTCTLTK